MEIRLPQIWVLMVLALAGCAAPRQATQPPPDQPHLRVMTYNVNYGLAGDVSTVEAITAGDAGLVLLQETTPAWEKVLRARFRDAYPHMEFRHCCGAGGLAVLSKYPLKAKEYIKAPRGGWFPGWRLVVESPIGPLQVLNVHLRPPVSDSGSVASGYFTTDTIRRTQMAAYWKRVESELPTVVAGDFNEDVDGDAVEFLAARGLESVLPEFAPSADTWRWQTSVGRLESRLDHIAYDRKLRALNAAVVDQGRSDHLPVVATFVRASDPAPAQRDEAGSVGSLSW